MLHDSNWTSRLPFDITLANFRPDSRLAEIVKRYIWLLFSKFIRVLQSFTDHRF
ncbi:unnamed protein product [Cylicostephanus goldi]|uniref:Uncharacterized protein n=1 Tax=Cylicostephanus goldi TaxID=71465 RepID=A0A3P7LRA2_CYLGO|nr:unnamed protein product [Cylicostephanus goldi]